jgi:hypothetical protein
VKKIIFCAACVLIFLMTSCANRLTSNIDARSAAVEKFSLSLVQEKVKKGISDKGDVIKALGSPNLISKKANGKEIYIWDKRSYETESASARGAEVRLENERTTTIAITFDEQGIVEDVTYRATSF